MLPEPCFRVLPGVMPLLLATASLFAGNAIAADDWPVLKPGMWESTREMTSIDGRKNPPLKVSHCVDPRAEMNQQKATLTKGGCQFSPVVRSGTEYRYSAECRIQGMSTVSRSVLTATSDSAYEIRVESEIGGEVTREVLRSRRVGDCSKK
jgi:hypothetical protein